MKKKIINLLLCSVLTVGLFTSYNVANAATYVAFNGSINANQATTTSITVNVRPKNESKVFVKWGEVSGSYTGESGKVTATKESPAAIVLDNLQPGKEYYFKVFFKDSTSEKFVSTDEFVATTKEDRYSISQAVSDKAQLSTIAFSGLAFLTGDAAADSFMPPGKVADFFGFQYMRDVDVAGYGHNSQFLTRAASNVLYILNPEQKAKLVEVAKAQVPLFTSFAYNRFPLMDAFRSSLEGNVPEGSDGLSIDVVSEYTGNLYEIDAELTYNRAVVMGEIINSFTEDQIAYLDKMAFNDFNTWPDVKEDEELKKSMSNTEFVQVMTYASELFSWYKGNLQADIYFCPERHGTYFGAFFLKDYPAMNNPDHFIDTEITGLKGTEFLNILNDEQRAIIESIIPEQKDGLLEIVDIRTEVSTELRKAMTGEEIDKDKIFALIQRYGEIDGEMSALYAKRFSEVNKTITEEQRAKLIELRDLDVEVEGAYMFSTPINTPQIPENNYMFGIGEMPTEAGNYEVPDGFAPTKPEKPVKPQ